MKAHGGSGCKSPHIHINDTRNEVGWLVLRSTVFTPGGSPHYSVCRRLSGLKDKSGHEGVKKNSTPFDTRAQTWVVQLIAKHIGA